MRWCGPFDEGNTNSINNFLFYGHSFWELYTQHYNRKRTLMIILSCILYTEIDYVCKITQKRSLNRKIIIGDLIA